MHGVALRLLMNEDQRKIASEFGYLRSLGFCVEFKEDDID